MHRIWKGLLAGGVLGTAMAALWMRGNRRQRSGNMASVKRMGRQTMRSMHKLRRNPRLRMVARAGSHAVDTGRDAYDWARHIVKKSR